MPDIRLVVVEKFESETQAATVAAWFEADGIETFIEGASASATLSYAGIASTKLLVAESQEQAARTSLAEYRAQTASQLDSWYCGHCMETIEGSFDLCWKCGQDRQTVARDAPEVHRDALGVDANNERIDITKKDFGNQNPYQPTQANLQSTDVYTAEQAEEVIERAHRSAVLGLGLPLLFTPSSFLLLLASYDCNQAISLKSRKTRRNAWIYNILVLICWASLIVIAMLLY